MMMNKQRVVYQCQDCSEEFKAEFFDVVEPPKKVDCPYCITGRASKLETRF